jgi:hypothetical protein
MEHRMHSISSALGEQFMLINGKARASNHGVNVRNQYRRFFQFIPRCTKGERDHTGRVDHLTAMLSKSW